MFVELPCFYRLSKNRFLPLLGDDGSVRLHFAGDRPFFTRAIGLTLALIACLHT